jgi:hypothetical protein
MASVKNEIKGDNAPVRIFPTAVLNAVRLAVRRESYPEKESAIYAASPL